MAKANPPQEYINTPFEMKANANGAQIIAPDICRSGFEYGNATANDSFSVGFFDEKWSAKWRINLANLENELMHRMITVYYGLWPENRTEYQKFKYVSSLLDRLEELLLQRATLARRLFDICGKPSSAREFATGLAELGKMNSGLPDVIYQFYEQFGILEHACQSFVVRQHPEVVQFLADLDRHSDEFRDGAWNERTAAIDACAREMEERLSVE